MMIVKRARMMIANALHRTQVGNVLKGITKGTRKK